MKFNLTFDSKINIKKCPLKKILYVFFDGHFLPEFYNLEFECTIGDTLII